MLASSLVEPGKVKVVDIPKPEIKPGEVLVRLEIGTICGSDVHLYKDLLPGVSYPVVAGFSGHEIVGVVEETDSGEFEVGDCVLIVPLSPPNGFSQWIVLPPENLVKIPDKPGLDELVVGQQLGTVIHATRRLPNITGWNVVVLGQGPAGLLINMVLRNLCAGKIVGIDILRHRLDVASKVGANYTVDASKENPVKVVSDITDGRMADMVVEAVGIPETYNMTPDLICDEGFITMFGIPKRGDGWKFAFEKFFKKHPTSICTSNTEKEHDFFSFKLAMEMIGSGQVDVKPLISHKLPLSRLDEALKLADTKEDGAVKIIMEMQK